MLELHSGNVEHPFKSSCVHGQSDVDIATNVQPMIKDRFVEPNLYLKRHILIQHLNDFLFVD